MSPDYRLLPEVSGKEILEDIDDFWQWFCRDSVEETCIGLHQIGLDRDAVLVVGESAGKRDSTVHKTLADHLTGGYLAMQLALSHPSEIHALITAYPMLDLRSRFYTECYSKPIVGVPNMPNKMVDDHLSKWISSPADKKAYISAADPPNRLDLAFAIIQNGRFLESFGQDRTLFPIERIENLAAIGAPIELPPTFLFHGKQDSAVPVDGSSRFVELLQFKAPDTKICLYCQDGDHGFDADATLDTLWLKEGLGTITKAWLDKAPLS